MSWSEWMRDVSRDDLATAEPQNEMTVKCAAEFEAAKAAALTLIDAGIVGDPDAHKFHVALNGHVNPNHEPAEGWSNDCVGVTISQA